MRSSEYFGQAEQAEVEAVRIQVRNTIKAGQKSKSGAS
jgi:hypothetical protein